MTVTTQDMRNDWAPPCATSRMVTIPFGVHGARITVDRRVVPLAMAFAAICAKHGYAIRPGVTGAYNCRPITGGSGYSLHAYGTTWDVNWDRNPYGPNLVTDMPPAMIREIEALRTGNGKQALRWGGRYSSVKDAMHFETIVTPADLATGIVGGPTTGDDVTPEDIKKINKGTAMLIGAATKRIEERISLQRQRTRDQIKASTKTILGAIGGLSDADVERISDQIVATLPAEADVPSVEEIADELAARLEE